MTAPLPPSPPQSPQPSASLARAAWRQAGSSALILLVFATLTTLLLGGAHLLTRDTIAANQAAQRRALLAQTLPPALYDNDLLATATLLLPLQAAQLGNEGEDSHLYRATLHGKLSAWVVEATAPNGYAGKIRLLVGVRADGVVMGVRVVQHRETPGLGDYIEAGKSDWISQFVGRRYDTPAAWAVKKDGGQFDARAGATVSPRAVIGAVVRVLVFLRAEADSVGL